MTSVLTNWTFEKTVVQTSFAAHAYSPYPIATEFVTPWQPESNAISLTFGMEALMASVGRTSTLTGATADLMRAKGLAAMIELNALVKDSADFEIDLAIQTLADSERTHFAGQIAAGVVDLVMSAMRYEWRDGAHILAGKLDPHADFIYGGGPADGKGVVLAESHGSFKDTVDWKYVRTRGKAKYTRQVQPYLTDTCLHGQVIHGYSIAFGSKPGHPGSMLHISETCGVPVEVSPDGAEEISSPSTREVNTPLGLSTHRSNFGLMGATPVVQWIDWVARGGLPPSAEAVDFLTFRYDGRNFVMFTSFDPQHPHFPPFAVLAEDPRCWYSIIDPFYRDYAARGTCGWFAMEERCAITLLKTLTQIISKPDRRVPDRLELAVTEPVGFGFDVFDGLRDRRYRYALYSDGLALLGGPRPRTLVAHSRWEPKSGVYDLFRDKNI